MIGVFKKKGSLTSQSAWILAAKIIGFSLNILLPLLIVRYLTQHDVGVYRQVFLVAANAVLILPFGVSMSAYYFLNREPERHSVTIFNILIFNFAMGLAAFAVLAAFPTALGSLFQNDELAALSPLIGLLILFWNFSAFLETAALANQEARLAAFFIVFTQVTKLGLMAASLLLFATVEAFLYAAIGHAVLQSVVLVAYLANRFPGFWRSFEWPFFRRQLFYALPYGFSLFLYVIQTDVHNYFVSHSFSPADFAIYSQGCFQIPLIVMLYESVASVLFPKVSELQAADKRREMLEMTVRATQKLAFIYFPLFAYLMIVGYEFITTLFTAQYAASVSVFRINLFTLPLFCLVVDPIARAYPEAGRFLLKFRIVLCVALIGVLWAGLGRFSLEGMITTVVAAILIEKVASAWISVRMLGASASDLRLLGGIGRTALAAAISGLGLLAVYLLAGSSVFSASHEAAAFVLTAAGLSAFIQFVGGCLFLGVFLLVYGALYLTFANLTGAIQVEDRAKFLQRFGRGGRTAASELQTAAEKL
jgi:O-antigen/teichoic acid export membrane protein